MSNTNDTPKHNYPAEGTLSEVQRLRAQHELCTAAVGGLILAPINLEHPNLRILDSGTADGFFLVDVFNKGLPKSTRDSAELFGTDVQSYPAADDAPPNLKLSRQNIFEPWPESWKGTFDLVCQRNTLANCKDFETAVDVVRRLAELVKPGGYIQLVDGLMPVGEIEEGDLPSQKMFKTIGNFLKSVGMSPAMGKNVGELLVGAGVVEVQRTEGPSRLGKGTKLEAASDVQLVGLQKTFQAALEKMPNPPIAVEAWAKMGENMRGEAEERGVDMPWFAAWGKVV